ncbi:MAG: CHAP domain-containing protein [Brevundimonas sp.]|uniref:CHAP domain-containing protein n=1 Tax=Brevundimonas sp. TaxID=1871086 RepID=UPI0025BC88E1|nr:CHAP domain-containing protein [Brevundimonas sp.]MBX3476812.1 CHAP domain-containing protein [Brevundimonas sp.]
MMKRFSAAVVAATLGFFALGAPTSVQADQPYWQCVTFARMLSGINIFGDAWTWWNQAVDKFRTGRAPETGSVLVFQPHGAMSRGHVAVVSDILTDRVIRVTHANWGGSRGRVEENVTVVDVSSEGDWSRVKVWYNPIRDLGTTVYPTYGFIYKEAGGALNAGTRAAQAGASGAQ